MTTCAASMPTEVDDKLDIPDFLKRAPVGRR